MLKLLTCVLASLLIAGTLLHLRHQRTEINYRINQNHKRLQNLQIELWNQQLQVAIYTAPNAIEHTVGGYDLRLVPSTPTVALPTDTE